MPTPPNGLTAELAYASSFLPLIKQLRIKSMQVKQLTFLIVTLAFLLPIGAKSSEIDVRAGEVRVRTEQNGGISVDTGRNSVELNERHRRSSSWWQPWSYWHRHRSHCKSSTDQRSTQITRINGQVEKSSISTRTCR